MSWKAKCYLGNRNMYAKAFKLFLKVILRNIIFKYQNTLSKKFNLQVR